MSTKRTSVKQSLELRDMLMAKPMTYEQLCEAGGLTAQRAAYWRKSNADNIYVIKWSPDKNGRLFVPVFAWGKEPDAPRPGRVMSSAERMRALRSKRKADVAGGVGLADLI